MILWLTQITLVIVIASVDAYHSTPWRRGLGTGKASRYLDRRLRGQSRWFPPWRPAKGGCQALVLIVVMPFVLACLILHIYLGAGDNLLLASQIIFDGCYWLPVIVFDVIDFLTEDDRSRRWRRKASAKAKTLLSKLKPAPAPVLNP